MAAVLTTFLVTGKVVWVVDLYRAKIVSWGEITKILKRYRNIIQYFGKVIIY